MGDRHPSSNAPKGRGRPSRRTRAPLDLNDLDTALPSHLPYQNSPQTTSNTAYPPRRQERKNRQAATVSSHPGWAGLQSSQAMQAQQSWASVSYTQSNLDKLLLLCHSNKELKKEGYILQELTEKELMSKMRCTICHGQESEDGGHVGTHGKVDLTVDEEAAIQQAEKCSRFRTPGAITASATGMLLAPRVCTQGAAKTWSCCMQQVAARGCEGNPVHHWGDDKDPYLHADWKYHQAQPLDFYALVSYPESRAAVAIDCEMGMSISGETELIRLTAIDFFTGATLIDRLVCPKAQMKHMNTRYSGVTQAQMSHAKAKRTCFFGRDAARDALLEYVGPETVLVMHGGRSDLTALRLLHPYVVDSFILEGYYGKKVEGGKSLKNLMKLKTGRDIQTRGKEGHDSLEDALAARELVIRFMDDIPGHSEVN